MSEEAFFEKMQDLYEKMKRVHSNTIKVIVLVSGIIATFMCVIIVQSYATTKQTEKVTGKLEMIDATQVVMNQLDEYRQAVLDKKIEETKADLQRQLDLLMRDRKMVERGLLIDEQGRVNNSIPRAQ